MNKHTPIEVTAGATQTPIPTIDNWKVCTNLTPNIEGNETWLRNALQSQADQYEREVRARYNTAIQNPIRGADGVANYEYNMGYLDGIKTIAQAHGVDLSE